jgi:chemotaxis response regulator CheB
MPKAPKKTRTLNGFKLAALHGLLASGGWRKQEADWRHDAKPQSHWMEWWNRGNDAVILAIHDGHTEAPWATVLTSAGGTRAVARILARSPKSNQPLHGDTDGDKDEARREA